MALRFREYWFGWLLSTIVLLFLLFIIVVLSAPHNDMRMRGFAPCTHAMAKELTDDTAEHSLWYVSKTVTNGYVCYAKVMVEGAGLWIAGEQNTPWANYIFEAENYMISPEDSEPFSENLLKANLLNEDSESTFLQNDIKENEYGQE